MLLDRQGIGHVAHSIQSPSSTVTMFTQLKKPTQVDFDLIASKTSAEYQTDIDPVLFL